MFICGIVNENSTTANVHYSEKNDAIFFNDVTGMGREISGLECKPAEVDVEVAEEALKNIPGAIGVVFTSSETAVFLLDDETARECKIDGTPIGDPYSYDFYADYDSDEEGDED